MNTYTEQDSDLMLEALNTCLKSLDPKDRLTFKPEELEGARERARAGLKLAIEYIEEKL